MKDIYLSIEKTLIIYVSIKKPYIYCNYIIRKEYFEYCKLNNEQKKDFGFTKEYELTTKLAKEKQIDYISLPAQTSQQIIKSINQYYNKKKSKLMYFIGDKGTSRRLEKLTFKRNNKITDYIHKTSRFVIDYCLEKNIGNIVIGYNEGWKQNVKISRSNNQNFVSIPFLKLIQQIKYKAELVGIVVQTVEENHTSKCDSFSLESIKHHDKYLGKRKKRGFFQSSINNLVNAVVNGAINILRKVIGNSSIDSRYRLLATQPVTVNLL